MSLSTQPYKGARDFYPGDKRLQKWIFAKWREVAERYGYEEYDAPLIEPLELYLAKTSQEIVTEQSYSFTDRGKRKVTIRPEMTPTVSRMVAAKRQELSYPLRWYSIPNVWRYERSQKGRFREHWQLNIDLFGIEGIEGDFEMIQVSHDVMRAFEAKNDMYSIKINSRKLINHAMNKFLGLTKTQAQTLIRLIDKKDKLERAEFLAKIDAIVTPTQREKGLTEEIIDLLNAKKLTDLPESLAEHESARALTKLFALCEQNGINNAVFDICLMRGFDYYTDIVFEVFDNHKENNRSMFGGGRYDGLVGLFGVEPLPTVGFGCGEATFIEFLEAHKLTPKLRSETDVYAILIGDTYAQAQPVINDLRGMGVNVAIDLSQRKLDKQLKTAAKKGVRYVLFIGTEELAAQRYKLKDLIEGQEESYSIERLVSVIKDHRVN